MHWRALFAAALAVGLAVGAVSLDGRAAQVRGLCKFSRANEDLPPGIQSTSLVGNGKLATSAYGVIDATPRTLQPDGSVSEKFWWYGAPGLPKVQLQITGRRLDAPAPRVRARINEGGVEEGAPGTRFWAAGITFPTAGCWNVVGRVGKVRLSFVVKVAKPAGE